MIENKTQVVVMGKLMVYRRARTIAMLKKPRLRFHAYMSEHGMQLSGEALTQHAQGSRFNSH